MHLEISVIAGLVLAVGSTRSALDVGLSPLRIFLLAFIAQYSLFKAYRVFVYPRYVSGLRHLPGPTDGHFFIGQMAKQLLTPGPVDIFLDWMRKWPDEPLIRYLSIGNSETIMVNSPAVLKEMQQTKSYSFCKPKIAARMFSPITGHGILFAEGDIHKRQRNQLSRPFSLSNVKKLLPVLQGKARELCAALGRDMGPDAAKAVTVEPFFQKAALDVLAIASIGYDLGSLSTASACFHAVYDRIIHQPRLGHVLTFLDGHVPLRAWLPLPLNRRWLRDNALIRQMLLGKLQLQKRRVLRRREGPDEGPDKGPDKGDHVPSGQGRDLLSFILEECRGSPGQENWDDQELLDFVGAPDTIPLTDMHTVVLMCTMYKKTGPQLYRRRTRDHRDGAHVGVPRPLYEVGRAGAASRRGRGSLPGQAGSSMEPAVRRDREPPPSEQLCARAAARLQPGPLPAARSVRGRHAGQHAHPQRHLGRHRASGHPFQHANLGPRRRGFPSRTMGRAWRKGGAGPGQ